MTIAALFVETDGCYYGLPGVDPWDITRDARRYPGPHRIVAHPPCQRWGRFSEGSPTSKVHQTGADDGCFESALRSLQRWGGVLEHPAHSKAWEAFAIQRPRPGGWILDAYWDMWVCEVEQGHYGHAARKLTWLLTNGPKPPDLIWGNSGQRLPEKRLNERGYESARRCGILAYMSSRQRQRTPLPFRDLLISIAEGS